MKNICESINIKKNFTGVGAMPCAKTLSVPLHRYSTPLLIVPFGHVQEKRGIEGVRQDDLIVRTHLLIST